MTNTTNATHAMTRVMLKLSGPKLLSRIDPGDHPAVRQLEQQGLLVVKTINGGSPNVVLTMAGLRIRDLMLDAAADTLLDWLLILPSPESGV